MKLTTKRNRWYFLRELFSYMIPMILIVGTVDVFFHFMQCPLHPEWSAPCSVNWIIAVIYGFFLVIVIILEVISATKLRRIKKQIEKEFLEATKQNKESLEKHIEDGKESENKDVEIVIDKVKIEKKSKPKKIIVEGDTTLKNKRNTRKTIKGT